MVKSISIRYRIDVDDESISNRRRFDQSFLPGNGGTRGSGPCQLSPGIFSNRYLFHD